MMQKTKLGVSVGLLGAALYFLGAISMLPAFLLVGYVLLFESNEWLKKTAVKMAVIVISFSLLFVAIDMIYDIFSFANAVLGLIRIPFTLGFPLGIDSMLKSALSFFESLLLLVMGISALSQGSVKVNFFDKIVDKNIQQ